MSFDVELLIEATEAEKAKDITPIPFKKWDEGSSISDPGELMVQALVKISDEMAKGTITSEQGKAMSADLRKRDSERHREAMKVIGERYGFAAEDEEMERRAKLKKSKLERAATKKPWAAKLMLNGNRDPHET